MSFYQHLVQQTAAGRQYLLTAPVIAAAQQGQVDHATYLAFLTQAFHHVRHTAPLLMACGAALPMQAGQLRKAIAEYIDEEIGHEEWILSDITAVHACQGQPQNATADTIEPPCISIELMVAYLYDQIQRHNPLALFGMVHVLEGTSVQLGSSMAELVRAHLQLPAAATSYLSSHGALDQEHYQFFQQLMDGIDDAADQQAIIRAANMVFRLYGDMLRSLPLPTYAH